MARLLRFSRGACIVSYHAVCDCGSRDGDDSKGGSQRGSRYFINWCFLLVWCGEPHQLGVDQSNKVWLNRREDCLQELGLTIICHPALYLPKLLLFRGEGFLEEVYPPSPTLFEYSYSYNSFISPSYTQAPLSLQ